MDASDLFVCAEEHKVVICATRKYCVAPDWIASHLLNAHLEKKTGSRGWKVRAQETLRNLCKGHDPVTPQVGFSLGPQPLAPLPMLPIRHCLKCTTVAVGE